LRLTSFSVEESDVSQLAGPKAALWTSRTWRSRTGVGVKGERFTPKAGHDPRPYQPEAR
jgi:hypothetical protein